MKNAGMHLSMKRSTDICAGIWMLMSLISVISCGNDRNCGLPTNNGSNRKSFEWNDALELKLEKYPGRVGYSSIIAYIKSVVETYYHRKLSGSAQVNQNEHEDNDNHTNDSGYVVGDKDLVLVRELSGTVIAHTSVDFLLFSLGLNKGELEVYLDCYGGKQGPERSPSSLETTISFVISSWETVDDGKERLSPQEKRVVLYKKSSKIDFESERFPRHYLQSIEAVYNTQCLASLAMKTFVYAKLMPLVDNISSLADKVKWRTIDLIYSHVQTETDLKDHAVRFFYKKLEGETTVHRSLLELQLIDAIFSGNEPDVGRVASICRKYRQIENPGWIYETLIVFFKKISNIRNCQRKEALEKSRTQFERSIFEIVRCFSELSKFPSMHEFDSFLDLLKRTENLRCLAGIAKHWLGMKIQSMSPLEALKDALEGKRLANDERILRHIFAYSRENRVTTQSDERTEAIHYILSNERMKAIPFVSHMTLLYNLFDKGWINASNSVIIQRWIKENNRLSYHNFMMGSLLHLIKKFSTAHFVLKLDRCQCLELLGDHLERYIGCFTAFKEFMLGFPRLLNFSIPLNHLFGLHLYLCDMLFEATGYDPSAECCLELPTELVKYRVVALRLVALLKKSRESSYYGHIAKALAATVKRIVDCDLTSVLPSGQVYTSTGYIVLALLKAGIPLDEIHKMYLRNRPEFFNLLYLSCFKRICLVLFSKSPVGDDDVPEQFFNVRSKADENAAFEAISAFDRANLCYVSGLKYEWEFKKRIVRFAHFFSKIDIEKGITHSNDGFRERLVSQLKTIADGYLAKVCGRDGNSSIADYIEGLSRLISIDEINDKRRLTAIGERSDPAH